MTFYADKITAARGTERLMCGTTAKHMIAVETGWFKRIRDESIYLYVFDSKGFKPIDEVAGYFVTKQAVIPKSVRKVSDILSEMLVHDVELRVMPSLWELREEVINSIVHYSIIRMRNAAPPPKGYDKFHPLP